MPGSPTLTPLAPSLKCLAQLQIIVQEQPHPSHWAGILLAILGYQRTTKTRPGTLSSRTGHSVPCTDPWVTAVGLLHEVTSPLKEFPYVKYVVQGAEMAKVTPT